MNDVVVALSLRTPTAKAPRGMLRQTRPDDLGAAVVRAILERAPRLDPEQIGDVIIGCAMPEGEQGMNVGRNIALLAGLPHDRDESGRPQGGEAASFETKRRYDEQRRNIRIHCKRHTRIFGAQRR